MKNITLAVDDDVLSRVRIVAAQRKTTVNALVREHLSRLAGDADRLARAKQELRDLSARTEINLGPDHRIHREDAYAGRGVPGYERVDIRRGRKEG